MPSPAPDARLGPRRSLVKERTPRPATATPRTSRFDDPTCSSRAKSRGGSGRLAAIERPPTAHAAAPPTTPAPDPWTNPLQRSAFRHPPAAAKLRPVTAGASPTSSARRSARRGRPPTAAAAEKPSAEPAAGPTVPLGRRASGLRRVNKAVNANKQIQINKIANRLADRARTKYKSTMDLFRKFDLNGDGLINFKEFQIGLKNNGFYINERDAREIYAMIDRDENRELDFIEFSELFEPKVQQYSKGRLHLHANVRSDKGTAAFSINPGSVYLKDVKPLQKDYLRDRVQSKVAVRNANAEVAQELLRAFQFVDPRKDGYITYDEFRVALGEGDFSQGIPGLNVGLTPPEVEDLISMCDVDRDGCISLREFIVALTKSNNGSGDMMNNAREELVSRLQRRAESPPPDEKVRAEQLKAEMVAARGGAGPSLPEETSEQVVERTLEMIRKRNRARGGLRKAFRTYDTDRSGKIEKDEFRNLLDCMNTQLNDDQFEMLWGKFDRDGDGSVYADEFCDAVFRDEVNTVSPFANASAKSSSAYKKFTRAASAQGKKKRGRVGADGAGGETSWFVSEEDKKKQQEKEEEEEREREWEQQQQQQEGEQQTQEDDGQMLGATGASLDASETLTRSMINSPMLAAQYSSNLVRAKSAGALHGRNQRGLEWSRKLRMMSQGASFTKGRPETSVAAAVALQDPRAASRVGGCYDDTHNNRIFGRSAGRTSNRAHHRSSRGGGGRRSIRATTAAARMRGGAASGSGVVAARTRASTAGSRGRQTLSRSSSSSTTTTTGAQRHAPSDEVLEIPISGASSFQSIRKRREKREQLSNLFHGGGSPPGHKATRQTSAKLLRTQRLMAEVEAGDLHVPSRYGYTPEKGLHMTRSLVQVPAFSESEARFRTTSTAPPGEEQRLTKSRRSRRKAKYSRGREMVKSMRGLWETSRQLQDIQTRSNARAGARSKLNYLQSMMKQELRGPCRRPGKHLMPKSMFPGAVAHKGQAPHVW